MQQFLSSIIYILNIFTNSTQSHIIHNIKASLIVLIKASLIILKLHAKKYALLT